MYLQVISALLTSASAGAAIHQRAAFTSITDCLANSSVPQEPPGTANFTDTIQPFNLRLPFTPIAVAVPTTIAQVQAAVACGASLGIFVSPKSGGHSYASHGLGGEDGHLMVDMKYFYNVTLDNSTGIATIGPGARLGNVATALWNQGQMAISHGSCPGYADPSPFKQLRSG
jgi:FAD/FMN-containing dehydrogenase